MSEKKLAGQVAWISGAASGMGAAIATRYAAAGAQVMAVDVQDEMGNEVVARIRAAGGTAVFAHCDVAQGAEVAQSIEAAVAAFGGLHILVNCAGIVHIGPLHEYEEADWDRMMAVNAKAVFLAVKYAVLGLSRSIALDYAAQGLRCNCICTGITDTPMLRYHLDAMPDPEGALEKRLQRVPMGVAIQPDDIARAALYFACEDSTGITGASLVVDGGWTVCAEWETAGPTRFVAEGR